MNKTLPREAKTWPAYILGGRVRTSTLVLIIAFLGMGWLYQTYDPGLTAPQQVPAREVVPPGFIPDPDYTWAPRTDVQRHSPKTPTTTTPTTTATTPTSPTTPTSVDTTAPSSVPGEPVSPTPSMPPQPSPTPAEPTRPAETPTTTLTERPPSVTQTPAAAGDALGTGSSTSAVSPPQ